MNSVVIGSGFGGIAAALRLKAKGHKVTLIEKHKDLGGRARVFKKNGFIYDGGPTVITAPYLINELFELFQKDPKNYIKLTNLKVWYQFIFEDKSKFNYSGNELEMKKQIKEINEKDQYYFVHSYYLEGNQTNQVIASTNYCHQIPAIVGNENYLGVQFHPEKSSLSGQKLISNWLKWSP